jgi:hypothetical protein
MNTRLEDDHELDRHLRRTLAAVAATIQEEPTTASARVVTHARGRRRVAPAAGAGIAVMALAAAAVVRFGPEYVDEIPPADPIVTGSIDGERYWVVDGRETEGCTGHPSGIELIVEKNNIVGQEWNTAGAVFGEPTREGCAREMTDSPPEDTYYSDGGVMVGDAMLWFGALHPDVDQVRADLGSQPFDVKTFEHEGASYYTLEVPPGTVTFAVEYLVDGQVVPPPSGERAEHVLPDD